MSNTTSKVILSTSDEAATYRTDLNGWVSRTGRYFGADERLARYDGCTHHVCACGALAEKSRIYCDACQANIDAELWGALPLVEWDGQTPLCIYRGDTYFFDIDQVCDYAAENDLKVSELRLLLCKPVCAHELNMDDWADELPEDDDGPEWLEEAISVFNAAVAAHRDEPLSWLPGNERVALPDEERAQ